MTNNSNQLTIEHVTITEVRDGLLRLTADDGFMLLNKTSRRLHKTLTTKKPNRFEVVADNTEG